MKEEGVDLSVHALDHTYSTFLIATSYNANKMYALVPLLFDSFYIYLGQGGPAT